MVTDTHYTLEPGRETLPSTTGEDTVFSTQIHLDCLFHITHTREVTAESAVVPSGAAGTPTDQSKTGYVVSADRLLLVRVWHHSLQHPLALQRSPGYSTVVSKSDCQQIQHKHAFDANAPWARNPKTGRLLFWFLFLCKYVFRWTGGYKFPVINPPFLWCFSNFVCVLKLWLPAAAL